jgi:Mrp family chromosome partitioning ATPase
MLALLVALIIHATDRRIYTAKDAQRAVGRAVVGTLPRVSRREREVNRGRAAVAALPILRPDSRFAAEIRRIALRIYPLGGWESSPSHKVVLVTSSQPNDGKTTVSVALGRTLARFGRSVVLVDAHGAEPNAVSTAGSDGGQVSFRPRAGTEPTEKPAKQTRGLTAFEGSTIDAGDPADEVAALEYALERALHPDPHSNLWLLDATRERRTFSSESDWRALLAELHRRHDVIIIDAPEVRAGPEPVQLGSFADVILIVARAGHTERMWLQDSVAEISAGSELPVEIVLNQA